MFVDMPEEQLRAYHSSQVMPHDFGQFWSESVATARATGGAARFDRVDCGLTTVDVFDVVFPGFGGHPIRAWLRMPRQRAGRLAAVVHFTGYGAGRGDAIDDLTWSAAGYAHLVMDTRGQGNGDTPDPGFEGPAPSGFLARGIDSPETYYYRRVFVDAVRAIDALRAHPLVDPDRVSVLGNSQGGGIALAATSLSQGVRAMLAQAPFLCDLPRAVAITDSYPYREIADFLTRARDAPETVFRTLSYFDGVNFAATGRAPAWFSAGLMDDIAPPSTVFAAHNAYAGTHHIAVWPFNGHDAGGSVDRAEALRVLRNVLGEPSTTPHLNEEEP